MNNSKPTCLNGNSLGSPVVIPAVSLRTNFSWTLVGNVAYAAAQWGVLIVLAKLGNPEMVGQFALALAITSPIFMFASLNLRAVQATDATDAYGFNEYVSLRAIFGFAGLIVAVSISQVVGYPLPVVAAIAAVALCKFLESFGDAIYGFFQKYEAMDLIGKSMVLKSIFIFALASLVLHITGYLFAFILGMGAGSVLILCIYDRHNLRRMRGASRWSMPPLRQLTKLAWLALPLGLVMMLNSLYATIPRYILEHHFRAYELGIFAAMAYLMVVGTTVIAALGQAASPRLAKHFALKDFKSFRKILGYLLLIAGVLGGVGFLAARMGGEWLLSLIYTQDYAAYASEFSWLMAGSALGYISSVLGYAITSCRQFAVQVPVTLISVVSSLVASLVLIPRLGIGGAVISIILVYMTQLPLKIWVLARSLKST